MKILIDTNIWIDYFTKREPFCHDAEMLLRLVQSHNLHAYINTSSISDIAYILGRFKIDKPTTYRFLAELEEIVNFIPTTKLTLKNVLLNKPDDVEDGLIEHSALEHDIDTIITRDKNGFSWLNVKTAEEYVTEFLIDLVDGVHVLWK